MSDNHAHAHDDGKVHAHISSLPFMVAIFGTLIFLTFVTVKVSYFDFGSANTAIAMLIATLKASLVAVFFMHLKYEKRFYSFIFVMSFVFLGVMFFLTLDDISTRGTVDPDNMVRTLERTGAQAPGGFVQFVAPVPAAGAHGAEPAAHGAATPAPAHH
ncbi:MAG: cytochrome C oxidase subunit IV family protein [Deltaproteobacteria bacterium]|nr:cytochrome C oxidase subunit IV family protein [Deltaproteobacteria bacterium]